LDYTNDKQLSDNQIRETAFYLYEEYTLLNITELILFFKRLHTGLYGEFYGRIEGWRLITFARTYGPEHQRVLRYLQQQQQLNA